MNLQEMKDRLAIAAYGITRAEAQKLGICIDCRRPFDPASALDIEVSEYRITALCGACFDRIGKDDS